MRWLRVLGVSTLAGMMLVMLAIYLTPLDVYVPEVEQALSERLHTEVNVGSMRLAAFPWPHLELRDTLLGGSNGIAIRSADVKPAMSELLAGRIVMHLELHEGAAHFDQVKALLAALSHAPPVKDGPRLGEIWLSGIIVLFPKAAIGPLDGKLEFSANGGLSRAWLGLEGKKLTAVLEPVPNAGMSLQLRGQGWAPSFLPGYRLDELELDGAITADRLVARRLSVATQGGRLAGSGWLDWSGGVRLHAAVDRCEIPLDRLMIALGKPVGLHGMLSGSGRLDASAAEWRGLWAQARFSGKLSADDVRARIAESHAQPLAIEHADAHLDYGPDAIDITGLTVRMYRGQVDGEIRMQRKPSLLSAKLSLDKLEMGPMLNALTNEMAFRGRLSGETVFAMNLDRLDGFPQNLRQQGKFLVENGVLGRIDLEKVAEGSRKDGANGGVTKFDSLAFGLNIGMYGYRFRDIRMSSGSFSAEGKLDISPAMQLNGSLDVELKRTAGLVSMPMTVSGTLGAPKVAVSGAAWAGAAVGTAILGPGLGTALGARVGGFLNKLFGGNGNGGQKNSGERR